MTFLNSDAVISQLTTLMTRNGTMGAWLTGVRARVMVILIMLAFNPRVIAFITKMDEGRCSHGLRRSSQWVLAQIL